LVMDPTKEQQQIMQSSEKVGEKLWQWLDKRSGKKAWRSPKAANPKMAWHMKSKVKSMLITFCDVKVLVYKELVLAGKRRTSAHYCDDLRRLRENVWRCRSEIWRQTHQLLHHDNAPSHTSNWIKVFRCFPWSRSKRWVDTQIQLHCMLHMQRSQWYH
jgi:hypothetical protein